MGSVAKALSRSWWLFLLLGAVSIAFGILLLFWPHATLSVIVVLIGLFVLASGVVGVFATIGAAGNHEPWGWQLAGSVIGILVGLIILKSPGMTVLFVLLVFGLWLIGSGVSEIVVAFADHERIPYAWLLVLAGAVSVLFGVLMLFWPQAGLSVLVLLAGLYAIIYGITQCVIAFRVRSLPDRLTAGVSPT